jgi:hypothetical protein
MTKCGPYKGHQAHQKLLAYGVPKQSPIRSAHQTVCFAVIQAAWDMPEGSSMRDSQVARKMCRFMDCVSLFHPLCCSNSHKNWLKAADLPCTKHCFPISTLPVPTTNCTQPQGSPRYSPHHFNSRQRRLSDTDHVVICWWVFVLSLALISVGFCQSSLFTIPDGSYWMMLPSTLFGLFDCQPILYEHSLWSWRWSQHIPGGGLISS